MGCTRRLFALFLIFGGLIMGFFSVVGGFAGQILIANLILILGLILLFRKSKKQ